MSPIRSFRSLHRFHRLALVAGALAVAGFAAPVPAWAGVGQITLPDLTGNWVATLGGVTGCGPSAMHVVITMNNAGSGTATLTTHGQCGDSVLTGQSFQIQSLNSNGVGTANLSCGPGCGWNLRFVLAPDRQVMNLADVDPVNPGNYLVGSAIHY